MSEPIDWAAVRAAMLALEDQFGENPGKDGIDAFIAALLDVTLTGDMEIALTGEAQRTLELAVGYAQRSQMPLNAGWCVAIGLLQGVTLAEAVRRVRAGS